MGKPIPRTVIRVIMFEVTRPTLPIFGVPPILPPLLAEASGRPEPERIKHFSAKMQKLLQTVDFPVSFEDRCHQVL